MPDSEILKVKVLSKSFPTDSGELKVLNSLNFNLEAGNFLSIVGPSGCGKTTLLEVIASLQKPTSGSIEINPNNSAGLSDLSLIVFQQYNRSMLPFLTVRENIRFVLESLPQLSQSEKSDRVDESLRITKLTKFSEYYPWQLSGGMQQRVAFARIIAARPKLVLLDETFGSLDAQTTHTLEDELLELVRKYNFTTIYVTHDIESAIYCGSRIIVLSSIPATIVKDISNKLPYPRNQIETKNDKRFLEYRNEIYSLIKQHE